jgi:two-component system response regulator YesN
MYKVLIVDDEPMIRAGLQTLIDWERYGFQVVGDAMNGREAMSKYAELAPHLIIIDIRMPVMDGLQVIEEIRKTDAACRFLILTGYADFDYAKRAIVGQVDSYVLKPVDEDEIVTELIRIYKYLSKQEKLSQLDEKSEAQRREKCIRDLLVADGDHRSIPDDVEGLIGSTAGGYQVLLLQLAQSQRADSRIYAVIQQRLIDLFETNKRRGIVFAANPYVGVLLTEPIVDEGARSRIYSEIKAALTDHIFHGAIGRVVKQIKEVSTSFEEAANLLTRHFLYGDEIIAQHDVIRACEYPATLDIVSLAEKIYYAMDMGNKESLEHWLQLAGTELIAFDSSEHGLKTNYAQLIFMVLNKLAGLNDKTYTIAQNAMPIIAQIYEQPNLSAIQNRIRQQLCDLTNQISVSSNEPLLKQIMDFVERHYAENLKLDTLAELFNYTSGYLGKIFKNYTGAHFHTYLDQIRIQKAIELLGEGHKVHQVAQRVGYANADYFHSKFKKYVGESPSSYKGKKN